jgi:hypothetical protein
MFWHEEYSNSHNRKNKKKKKKLLQYDWTHKIPVKLYFSISHVLLKTPVALSLSLSLSRLPQRQNSDFRIPLIT